jgi:hypothetical protein
MAKKNTKKVEAVSVVVADKTAQNREARIARHLKRHPTDGQAIHAPKVGAKRKKPVKKGDFPSPVYVARDASGKGSVVNHTYGEAELFSRGRMKPADYAEAVRKMRQPTASLLKATQGKFGLVPVPPSEKDLKENVRAMCWALGVRYTGADSRTRKPYKGKR